MYYVPYTEQCTIDFFYSAEKLPSNYWRTYRHSQETAVSHKTFKISIDKPSMDNRTQTFIIVCTLQTCEIIQRIERYDFI